MTQPFAARGGSRPARRCVDRRRRRRGRPAAARELVNVDGTRNVVALGVPVVYYSTDYVFDGSKREPYVESDEPRPLSVYGRTKLEGEREVREGWIVRSSWLFGWTRHELRPDDAAARRRARRGERGRRPARLADLRRPPGRGDARAARAAAAASGTSPPRASARGPSSPARSSRRPASTAACARSRPRSSAARPRGRRTRSCAASARARRAYRTGARACAPASSGSNVSAGVTRPRVTARGVRTRASGAMLCRTISLQRWRRRDRSTRPCRRAASCPRDGRRAFATRADRRARPLRDRCSRRLRRVVARRAGRARCARSSARDRAVTATRASWHSTLQRKLVDEHVAAAGSLLSRERRRRVFSSSRDRQLWISSMVVEAGIHERWPLEGAVDYSAALRARETLRLIARGSGASGACVLAPPRLVVRQAARSPLRLASRRNRDEDLPCAAAVDGVSGRRSRGRRDDAMLTPWHAWPRGRERDRSCAEAWS